MKLILKIAALVCLAVAAFVGLITVKLPIDFGWAGIFLWWVADLV